MCSSSTVITRRPARARSTALGSSVLAWRDSQRTGTCSRIKRAAASRYVVCDHGGHYANTYASPFLPGFTRANGAVRRRLILTIEALEGAGKTRFTLTAPGPIAFLNFDYGLEGVIEAFQVAKPIDVAPIKLDFAAARIKRSRAAETELVKFEINYQTALKQARTIVIDTGPRAMELMRMAEFGKLAAGPAASLRPGQPADARG